MNVLKPQKITLIVYRQLCLSPQCFILFRLILVQMGQSIQNIIYTSNLFELYPLPQMVLRVDMCCHLIKSKLGLICS